MLLTVSRCNYDLVGGNECYLTVFLRYLADTGVLRCTVFHTGTDDRSFRLDERYSLTLHVGAHESTVRVVVSEERNKRCSNRYELLRRYVHVIDTGRIYLDELVEVTADDFLADELAVLVDRLVRLCDVVVIFLIRGHVNNFVSNDALFLVADTVRCLYETIVVDLGICSQRVDKTDVRTFRCLDRAHTAVVRGVNVSNFEVRTVTGKTARTESGQTALMSKLCQRVRLIHELGQLGRSEELLNSCAYRTGIYELVRMCRLFVGSSVHSFTDISLHTGETDADLVLEEFTNRTDTTVT